MRKFKVTIEGQPTGKPIFEDAETRKKFYLGMRIDAREIDGDGLYIEYLITDADGKVLTMDYSKDEREVATSIPRSAGEFGTICNETHTVCVIQTFAYKAILEAKDADEMRSMKLVIKARTQREKWDLTYDSDGKKQTSLFEFDDMNQEECKASIAGRIYRWTQADIEDFDKFGEVDERSRAICQRWR